jgi:hypothetical protein
MLLTACNPSLLSDQCADHSVCSRVRCSSASSSTKGRVVLYKEHILWPRIRWTLLEFIPWTFVVSLADGSVSEGSVPLTPF